MFKKKTKEIDPASMSKAASAYLDVVMEWHERESGGKSVSAGELLGVSVAVLANVVHTIAGEVAGEELTKQKDKK